MSAMRRAGLTVIILLLTAPQGVAAAPKTLADLTFIQSAAARETPAATAVLEDAKGALTQGPWSVMDKPRIAPSGDKHDYFSVPPYWWPNPNTPDGLPYIRKDGEVNPDRDKYDNTGLNAMCRAVETLGLAYALSGDDKFVARASLLLNTWFLAPETRMNPNLNYAQGVPGRNQGRAEGIIDADGFKRLLDCVDLLAPSPAFSKETQAGLRAWFGKYLDWLLDSPIGRAEAAAGNNHGTCYDVQASRIALYVGRDDVAREILSKVAAKRIDVQVEPDGRQPRELARTKSFDYSLKNLEALMELADLGRHFDIDLWAYASNDGRSIHAAFDFVVKHSVGGEAWPGENIHGMNVPRLLPLIQRAARHWDAAALRELLKTNAPPDWDTQRTQLWYPAAN